MDKKSLRRHWPSWPFVGVLGALLFIFTAAFIYFGIYNIAADAPHTKPVYALLESLRDRSITVHARSIAVPKDLDVQKRVTAGGGLYGEMCAGCHLGPGVARSELSQGLYPQAPELAKHSHLGPAEQFWIIKHGVKLSAMPAWGKTHPDPLIWDMVAFVRRLPGMSAKEYQQLVASAPEDHDAMMQGMKDGHDEHMHGEK